MRKTIQNITYSNLFVWFYFSFWQYSYSERKSHLCSLPGTSKCAFSENLFLFLHFFYWFYIFWNMILVQLWAAQSDLSEGEHCSRQHNQLSHWKVFFIENFSTEGSSFLRKMSGNLEKKKNYLWKMTDFYWKLHFWR